MLSYAGIGSRKTPEDARELIHEIAIQLNKMGWILRSGGADGADTFFEEAATRKEIFLPWKGYNNRPTAPISFRVEPSPKVSGKLTDSYSMYFQGPTQEAIDLAEEQIAGYRDRKQGVRKLLARNMHQVLGENLDSPVECVICWTPDGKICGGTAYAIHLAKSRDIPVYNLAKTGDVDRLKSKIGLSSQQELW